jgi:hypothetical protein
MNAKTSLYDEWTAIAANDIDGAAELASVVSALEMLRGEFGDGSDLSYRSLIELHGALLLFQLGGDARLLPKTSFGLFGRRVLERHVVGSARELARVQSSTSDAAFHAWSRAAGRIESLIALIDPDLAKHAA